MEVLQQIDLNLVQCEMFASSEPVPGMEEGVLVMCFSDLRQLRDLFVSWNWSTYFTDFGKSHSSRFLAYFLPHLRFYSKYLVDT